MPFRSLIEFKVQPGAQSAFAAAYLDNGFLRRAQSAPGFVNGEFLQPDADGTSFWATVLWRTQADYAAWQRAYLTVFSASEIQAIGQYLVEAPVGIALAVMSEVEGEQDEN